MKRHLVTRYQPWMSEVPADTGQVPLRALVLLATLPLVLVSGFVARRDGLWYPNQPHSIQEPDTPPQRTLVSTPAKPPHLWGSTWTQEVPNLAVDSNADRVPVPSLVVQGYRAPHLWGQLFISDSQKADDKFSPGLYLPGKSAPDLSGRVTLLHPLQNNGPERTFPNSLYLAGASAPNKTGYLWYPEWGGGAKGQPIPRLAQQILTSPQLPIGPIRFDGSVTWLSRSSILDDAEHQRRVFNRFQFVTGELNDFRRRQLGSVWTTGLEGRKDPPEGQEKPSILTPTSSFFPGRLFPRGFVWQPQRPIQLFDMRPFQASIYLPGSSYPRVHLRGSVWKSIVMHDETSNRRTQLILSDAKPKYAGTVWQSQVPRRVDKVGKSQVVLAQSFHFPGKVTHLDSKLALTVVPRVTQGYLLVKGSPAPLAIRTGRYVSTAPIHWTAPVNYADYYWRAGTLKADWATYLVGTTDCTRPWATTLTERWIIGKLTL